MAASRKPPESQAPKRRRPATTPEARNNQLIALAFDLAEKQILDGTASAQVISHFLKEGTLKTKAELKKLELEADLLVVKKQSIQQAAASEQIAKDALEAMRGYQGLDIEE